MSHLILGPCQDLYSPPHRAIVLDHKTGAFWADQGVGMAYLFAETADFQMDWASYQRDRDVIEATLDNVIHQLCAFLRPRSGSPQSPRTFKILMGHTIWRLLSICRKDFTLATRVAALGDRFLVPMFDGAGYDPAPANLSDFQLKSNTDSFWRVMIRQRAFEICARDVMDVQIIPRGLLDKDLKEDHRPAPPAPVSRTQALRAAVSKRASYVIYKSYLPRRQNIALQLRLGQLPVPPRPVPIPSVPTDHALRAAILAALQPADLWEKFAFETIVRCVPRSLLELNPDTDLDLSDWPKGPKAVFTSNAFDEDEGFTHWLCRQIDRHGTKYIVGQHGHPYRGVSFGHMQVEQTTCDRFLSWGADAAAPPCPDGFCFAKPQIDTPANPDGPFSLILRPPFNDTFNFDVGAEFARYVKSVVAILDHIPADLRKDCQVKPHKSHGRHVRPLLQYAQENTYSVVADTVPFDAIAQQSRLLIFGYMSSGVVHALARNQPFCVFMEYGLAYFDPAVHPAYQALLDAKIAFVDPKDLADHLADIQHDIMPWWQAAHVQNAVATFSKSFAQFSKTPVMDMVNILKNPAG